MRFSGRRRCTGRLLSTAAMAVAMTIGLAGVGSAQDATPTAMGDDLGAAYPTIFIAETVTTLVPSPWSASRISCSRNGWQGCRGVTDTGIVAE